MCINILLKRRKKELEEKKKRKTLSPRLGQFQPVLPPPPPSLSLASLPLGPPRPTSTPSHAALSPSLSLTAQPRSSVTPRYRSLAPAPSLARRSRPSVPSPSPVLGIDAIIAGHRPPPFLAITRSLVKFGTDSSPARCDRVPACHRLHRAIPSPPLCRHYRRRCVPHRCPPASAPPLPQAPIKGPP
jgi:hypothetical protein